MTIRDISEVGARLEKAVARLSGDCDTPQQLYDLYEATAIQILDSEFDDFLEGELENYLMEYLERKRKQLI